MVGLFGAEQILFCRGGFFGIFLGGGGSGGGEEGWYRKTHWKTLVSQRETQANKFDDIGCIPLLL